MDIGLLLASALGGGIIASVMESWFVRVRAYETARLQVLDDLDSINAMSMSLTGLIEHFGDKVTIDELQRIGYPTQRWVEHRAAMVTRLARVDPGLLKALSALFASLAALPLVVPLDTKMLDQLPKLHKKLEEARLGWFASAIVYGPRYRP